MSAAPDLIRVIESAPFGDPVTSLGLDPGGVTGLLAAVWLPGQRKAAAVWAVQVNMAAAVTVFSWIVLACPMGSAGMEAFRPGTGRADPSTRDLCKDLEAAARGMGVRLGSWPAATVKPWTGDKNGDRRLRASGLFEATAGQPHARDGARYSLYAAVHGSRLPDPLSRQLLATAAERGRDRVP